MIATSTNDWVTMCKYGLNTCKKMDELVSKGPWAECVISTALYHCVALTQILELPGETVLLHFFTLIIDVCAVHVYLSVKKISHEPLDG